MKIYLPIDSCNTTFLSFLEGDYDTMGGFDIRDLLTEIRHLRVQLERCIETNNALRQKLEEHLLHQHSPRSHPNKDKSQSPARSGKSV